MKYDFTTAPDRRGVGSSKWEQMLGWNPNVSEGIIPLSVADMELKNPPEIIEGLKEYLDNIVLGYTNPTEAYFTALKGWMKRRHNWDVKDEWIVTTPGVVTAFFQAVRVLSEEGDGIILMTPIYYPMYMAIERNNRKVVRNSLIYENGRYTIDFDDLEAKAKDPKNKVLILCSPHNPTGRVWTKEELERIGRICIDNDVFVVSDEIHFDIVMPGHKHTVFSTISEEFAMKSMVLTAPSKTFNIAGMQGSNIMIPDPVLRQKYLDAYGEIIGHLRLNIMAYKACELAYNHCEEWLEELLVLIRTNAQVMTDYMKEHMPKVDVVEMEGTYLLWLDFRALGIDKDEMERIMHMEAEVFLDEGYIFGDEGIGFERVNLACPTKVIEDACVRIKNAFAKYL